MMMNDDDDRFTALLYSTMYSVHHEHFRKARLMIDNDNK